MKKSNLTFAEGFLAKQANAAKGKMIMAFDWDKAAKIIKEKLGSFPDLIAEAGLQGDWNYTGGIIFQDGEPFYGDYTFLSSNWAKPTLIISVNGTELLEIDCFAELNERFQSDSKWDEISLALLNK